MCPEHSQVNSPVKVAVKSKGRQLKIASTCIYLSMVLFIDFATGLQETQEQDLELYLDAQAPDYPDGYLNTLTSGSLQDSVAA